VMQLEEKRKTLKLTSTSWRCYRLGEGGREKYKEKSQVIGNTSKGKKSESCLRNPPNPRKKRVNTLKKNWVAGGRAMRSYVF